MGKGYRLQEYKTPDGNHFWELLSDNAAASEFTKMMKSPKKREAAINLVRQIDKIIRYGIQDSCMTNKMRLLDTKIGLYELKGHSGVDREMVYVLVRAPLEIVLLFSFKGHQGSGNIHSEIHRARPLAKIAAELLHELHDHL